MIAHMICFRVNSIIFYPSGFSYQTSYSYKDISLFMYHKKTHRNLLGAQN
ncbi:hypothetical protein SAMN05444682_104237 [Parapedobacter indicus]|uniref:Uncharacterized protein n=1 Tax=Parapedobacter indicus TaxID=1477437 RepID=A0A1I3IWL4_9SPHI|nr:hypothetical protein CLV26_104238 [Parapedobacter indicus]SFI52213.1 hypothetical protein SAMN05444682_104237 [Parapedobacter indicus]